MIAGTLVGLMEQLCASGEVVIFAHQLTEVGTVLLPFENQPFACLLWDYGLSVENESSGTLILSLLRAGCRYFVCGGVACEAWHDLVDDVFVQQQLDASHEERERSLVMTTWHTGESPADVAFFFLFNTNIGDVVFQRYLVLHLGATGNAKSIENAVIGQFASLRAP